MKTYDLVKRILSTNEQARNSDKLLITEVIRYMGYIKEVNYFEVNRDAVLLDALMSKNFPSFESITRARRKVQENFPELQSTSPQVRAMRQQKQLTKGTFIYREELR